MPNKIPNLDPVPLETTAALRGKSHATDVNVDDNDCGSDQYHFTMTATACYFLAQNQLLPKQTVMTMPMMMFCTGDNHLFGIK
jgi:hypothetical protein